MHLVLRILILFEVGRYLGPRKLSDIYANYHMIMFFFLK